MLCPQASEREAVVRLSVVDASGFVCVFVVVFLCVLCVLCAFSLIGSVCPHHLQFATLCNLQCFPENSTRNLQKGHPKKRARIASASLHAKEVREQGSEEVVRL